VNSLSSLIDHTNLRPDALHSDIEILCKEAVQYKFASVCINPVYVSYAKSILKDENPKVCSVVGFPLGADSEEMKYAEARFLIFQGVDEIDMVMNIAFLKERKLDLVKNETKKVVEAADGNCVKVIIETSLLNQDEKALACNIVMESGAAFVKTSTGFSSSGATLEDVRLIKKLVGDRVGIKASGGIKTKNEALKLIEAGATRIGTSRGVEIIS
jgi:deoxyribose-phosphate aldolase|tara:strand:- start:4054 stop:4695 length:642 start_codon:yes stop_codon:yes gene_type:complete